jgi:hypothetical protein
VVAEEWPFEDAPNVATITVRQIMIERHPILLASRDDDGWQFLTGGEFQVADALVVGLKNVVAIDPTLLKLVDLPLGWEAWRESPAHPWNRRPTNDAESIE